jgi:putative transposase
MARLARLAVGGFPHLVVQRSTSRPLLLDEADAARLIATLHDAISDCEVALHGYALMPHGLWLLATPADASGIGRAMQSIGRRYVRWVNDRRSQQGGLFSGRYRATLLEPETQLLEALRYIEWQPVTAGLANAPEEYRWSSCRHHLGLAADPLLKVHAQYWSLGNTPFERQAAHREWLEGGPSPDRATKFEQALAGGWVMGSAGFLRRIEHLCSRRPRRERPGRPRRARASGISA